jgi:hypothetical protein
MILNDLINKIMISSKYLNDLHDFLNDILLSIIF